MTIEAGVGLILPQIKEFWQLEKARDRFVPGASGSSIAFPDTLI